MFFDEQLARVRRACETWPVEQQAVWIDQMCPIIGEPRWKPVTQYQCAGIYTRFLVHARNSGETKPTPEGIRSWVRDLEAASCSARTISGYLWVVQRVSTVLSGEAPRWLIQNCLRLEKVAKRTSKRKNGVVVPAEAILQFGLETIARAKELGPETWPATQLFRDGLLLVFGVHGPERLRALTSIDLKNVDLERFMVTYPGSVIKGGATSVRTLPEMVAALVREWVSVWRARHLNGRTHSFLWIAMGGRPLGAGALTAAMRTLTKRAPWGHPITPHRLRDAAATCLVEEGPFFARLASIILGHQSERTTLEYTETSKRIAASRDGRKSIALSKEKIGRKYRLSDMGESLVRQPSNKRAASHLRDSKRQS